MVLLIRLDSRALSTAWARFHSQKARAVLAVLFLGERLSGMQVAGLALAGAGVLVVQLAKMRAGRASTS